MAEGSVGGQIPKSHFTKGKYLHFSFIAQTIFTGFTSICFHHFGLKKRNMLLLLTKEDRCISKSWFPDKLRSRRQNSILHSAASEESPFKVRMKIITSFDNRNLSNFEFISALLKLMKSN